MGLVYAPTIYLLLLTHFVADFLCQSDWMALNKSKRWDALALHVGVYAGVLYAVTAAWSFWWVWPAHGVESAYVGPMVSATNGLDIDLWWMPHHAVIWWRFALQQPAWFVLANAAAHFMQDAITSRITSRLWFIELEKRGDYAIHFEYYAAVTPGKRHWFFVAIGFDQLLHYVTLFVTAGWWLH